MNEIEIDRPREWLLSVDVMKGLYPKWEITPHQLEAWQEKFSVLNPDWFREAIRLMYTKYSGDNPKPKWLELCFREIKAGHTGTPLNESQASDNARRIEQAERLREAAIVEEDRERHWFEVSGWKQDERVSWAKTFSDKYRMFSERNKPEDMSTWSKTFCSFVYVYRKMEQG